MSSLPSYGTMPALLRIYLRILKSCRTFHRFLRNLEEYQRDAGCSPAARGGFSDIYKLKVPRHGLVAVKRLRLNEYERQSGQVMLANETKILAMIKHANILPFIGISSFGGQECIVSPWATNGALSLYLERNSEADRLRLMREIASALDYLHTCLGNPVIHGDICIENVLVSASGTALLSDFGFSGIVSRDDDTPLNAGPAEFYLGRAAYNAPELYDGATRSRATDIFAFGMLMFRVYAGKLPFISSHWETAANAITVLAIHRGERPQRYEITRADFSDALWQLMESCWEHRAKLRPRASQVLRRLEDSLSASS